MQDQVQNLKERGIPAVAIHSGMPYPEIDRLLDNCAYGDVKFLYLSPERLHTTLFRERLKKMSVNLIAVDEAHCISQWGYDFRPAYLEIATIRELLPKVPILALTASATPEVVQDIQEKLQFRKSLCLQKSFTRSNLAYVIRHTEAKPEELLKVLQGVNGSGIVYVRNRRQTKETAIFLRRRGITADFYHAGLSMEKRNAKQEAWINNQIRIMVSTNAFGMGIDKPDVRVVVHLELPDSLEAYYQEAGRAGRDGKKAYAVLLFNTGDKFKLEKQHELAYPPLEEVRQVYRALGSYFQLAVGAGEGEGFDFDLVEFSQVYKLDALKTLNALRLLEKEGLIILTEAVYYPASLRINVNQDELYDFMLKHPKLDKVLKVILRSYQGAFQHFIHIRESTIARFLNSSRADLQRSLRLLQKENIIEYRPQKDQPQLFFINGRLDANQLHFDHQGYRFRRERQAARIESALAYANGKNCRSRQLVAYFGEKEAPKCGICDVCLQEKKEQKLSPKDYQRYRKKLELVLKREKLSLEETLASFAETKQNLVLEVLEYLIDEGVVKQQDELLLWQG